MMCGIKESQIKALQDVAYFSQLLIDSVICYDDGDVTIGSHYLDMLSGSLKKLEALDEITP